MFASFFKAPLLDAKSVEREVGVIEEEYRTRISNETIATDQVERQALGGSERFIIGSRESLMKDNMMEELAAFYNKHYSSDRMSLCLVGNWSIDELDEMAKKYFHDVPMKEPVPFEVPYTLASEKILKIVP